MRRGLSGFFRFCLSFRAWGFGFFRRLCAFSIAFLDKTASKLKLSTLFTNSLLQCYFIFPAVRSRSFTKHLYCQNRDDKELGAKQLHIITIMLQQFDRHMLFSTCTAPNLPAIINACIYRKHEYVKVKITKNDKTIFHTTESYNLFTECVNN